MENQVWDSIFFGKRVWYSLMLHRRNGDIHQMDPTIRSRVKNIDENYREIGRASPFIPIKLITESSVPEIKVKYDDSYFFFDYDELIKSGSGKVDNFSMEEIE